ncbi:MAG: ATPase, T2SS/T4P/T4SS family, partial [Ignisphaera sp.]
TGAGKTSTLNALATLLRPTYKIVTIEDTPELRLPHENWVQLVSRPSYIGSGVGEVSLFHLVKLSLRYRPDIIVVGEVRGEEAYVLFQAIATGHSGMTTLHAENVDAAVKRLTSPPMNIPPSYIPLVNIVMVIRRVQIRDEEGRPRPARRITNVWEVKDYENYLEIAKWNPAEDAFTIDLSRSIVVDRISELTGLSRNELIDEVEKRKQVLIWLAKKGLSDYRSVSMYVYRYYVKPKSVLKEVGLEKKITQPATLRRPARRTVITFKDVFTAFSLSFFESPGRALAKIFEFEKLFSRAGLHIHPIKYGAETIAMVFLSVLFVVLGFVTTLFTVKLSIIQLVIGVMICVIIPIVMLIIRLAYPYTVVALRRIETENELPFFMAYVATMVRGGYGLEKVIERVSQLKIFKAIRREAQRVITRVKMFGDDPITALEKVASDHPSTKFRDIMLGYTTTLRSGGDVLHYLEIRTRELFETRMNEVRNIL